MIDEDVQRELNYLSWLLSDVNREGGTTTVLRPGSMLGRVAQNLTRREYQLCKEGADDARILFVSLDQFTTDGSLQSEGKI